MEVVSFYVSSSIKTYSIFFFFYEPNTVYIYLSLRPPFIVQYIYILLLLLLSCMYSVCHIDPKTGVVHAARGTVPYIC